MSVHDVYSRSYPFSIQAVQNFPLSTDPQWEVGEHAWVSVQVVTQYTGSTPTVNFQVSNDGTNWTPTVLQVAGAAATNAVQLTTTTGLYHGPLPGKYFRITSSGAYSSGTLTGTVVFSPATRALETMGVASSQQGTWNVGSLAVATGGYSFLNIPTAATQNAIKSGAGTLHNFTINTQVASATATLYDALTATGTKIGTITLPASLVGDGPITVPYDIAFAVGLTIVTVGTNFDCTVSYK